MKQPFTTRPTLADSLAAVVLVLVPFHAFLTVWAAAGLGHYVLLRLWDEALFLVLAGVVVTWLAREKPLRQWLVASLVTRLILLYAGLTLLLGAISYLRGDVTLKALGYGLTVNLRYLFWFLAVALCVHKSAWLKTNWRRLLLIPATFVVVFGVLQFSVLPHNFLSHFGYNEHTTISPTETINHNAHYIRVQSTLRGANPLGAYLVLVTSLIAVTLLAQNRRRIAYGLLGLLVLVALYASGSRSAWIGAVLAVGAVLWLRLKTRRSKIILTTISVVIILLAGSLFLLFHNNTTLQNALLHTQAHSAVATSSNADHASALRKGVADVIHQPFGDGPGTAGPASEYNGPHVVRIAEDYYVQVAQETGWLGLGLLLAVFVVIAVELYRKSNESPLALTLLASLVGLAFVGLLSHVWVDDTLAYIWWGLAGIALAPTGGKNGKVQD